MKRLQSRGVGRHLMPGALLSGEALLSLVVAKAAVRLLPFRWLLKSVGFPPNYSPTGSLHEPANSVRRLCSVVARVGGNRAIRADCLPRALAAHWMLRRRHVASIICFGVKREPQAGVCAHACLKAGDQIVMGGREMAGFIPIIEFPATS